ncbi:hypothetical protein DRN94_001770 [archaeon]|nr:hypothetical protein [archaeon]
MISSESLSQILGPQLAQVVWEVSIRLAEGGELDYEQIAEQLRSVEGDRFADAFLDTLTRHVETPERLQPRKDFALVRINSPEDAAKAVKGLLETYSQLRLPDEDRGVVAASLCIALCRYLGKTSESSIDYRREEEK